jgi:MFS superfamily sulfate permease-like transporter
LAKTEPLQFPKMQSEKAEELFGEEVLHREPHRRWDRTTGSCGGLEDEYPGARDDVFPMLAASRSAPGTPALTYSEWKTNILSGLTVALALVPEAIAFALVAHVNPLVGLYAALP